MAKTPAGDVFFASISELSTRLRAKEFSAVELTNAFCDRLEKIGGAHNALALSLRKSAIKKAKDVDDDLKRDRTRGPLQGIPYGAKDLLAVKKQPTEWGSRAFAGQKFDEDAFVIKKLDAAGAILIGKLAMIELAGGIGYRTASASSTGPAQNPWDRTRWAGGSSSGPGVATAAGLVTFALGSETSGSIITPSAFCGVTGLRPTYGLVSRNGAMALSWTLDKIGPMCRSAEDCGLVLHAIAGADPDDPASAKKGFAYVPQFDRKITDFTIGYAPIDFERDAPEAQPALQAALAVMKASGARFKEVEIPDFPYGALIQTVIGAEAASIFEDLIRGDKLRQIADPSQAATLKAALDIPAVDYLKAMRIRTLVRAAFRELYYDIDMLLTPSRLSPAPRLADGVRGGEGRTVAGSRGLSDIIPAGNLAGLPAISLPCGFAGALPVGISLVGRPWFENHLIGVGRVFQEKTDWHKRKPQVGEA
ncbi:MAG TPA: amidase [Bryobacteraceae bacterium]|nr:amidase [Bryobacteraceae bacterium]